MQQSVSAPTNALSWFAIPATDFDRAVRFYETILETKLYVNTFGGEAIGVFPHAEDGIAGCVTSGTPSTGGVLVYLCADGRLDRTLEFVATAGGSIETPKTALPQGMGYSAHIVDTEGNRIGLHAKG